MRESDKKDIHFRMQLADVLRQLRLEKTDLSCNKFANEYGLNDSNLGKIERAIIDCKFITLWKIIEALDIDFIDFARLFKEKLGDDFKLMDE